MSSVTAAANAGRPRKPTALKKLTGTYQKCREEGRGEPDSPPMRMPAPPRGMTEVQRGLWVSHARVLDPRRVTTAADVAAFDRFVRIHAIVIEAETSLYADAVDGHPRLVVEVVTKFGISYQQRQELKVIAQYEKLLMYYFSRFGLTPADRSRAAQLAEPAGDDDPLSEFDA